MKTIAIPQPGTAVVMALNSKPRRKTRASLSAPLFFRSFFGGAKKEMNRQPMLSRDWFVPRNDAENRNKTQQLSHEFK